MRAARIVLGVGVVLVAVAGTGLALADGGVGEGDDGVLGPGTVTVVLGIEHSSFSLDQLTVREGTEIRFVLDNGDPIRHELIVGPPEVHQRHEAGTEPAHPPRPGEVSVEPLSTAATTYTFDDPGSIEFACHLPGHRAYGMTGTVTVLPA